MTKDSTRKWLLTLFLGLILWSFLFFTRVYWYSPWCMVMPTPCLVEHVNAFDRIVFQFRSVQADFWSNVLQNFTGVLVFFAPWLLFRRAIAAEETLYTASVSIWNLVWMEIVRALVQRPRPMVFHDVFGSGGDIGRYNSFYSGHTSFVALASLCFVFMMKRRYPQLSKGSERGLFLAALTITVSTAILRILGGRHYPTDTIAGFIIGCAITFYFQRQIRKQNDAPDLQK